MLNSHFVARTGTTWLAAAGLLAVVLPGFLQAQAQAPAGSAQDRAERLPVRRVVLYKSGIGYFEHLGRVQGNATVTIDFTSGQLNDVLKSLTTLDLDGGQVVGVNYNTEATLGRRLGTLRLGLGERTTRFEFLSALRGANLEIRIGAQRIRGRLLSVERLAQPRDDGNATPVDTVSIVSDGGALRTFALVPGVDVRVLDADLGAEIDRYLSLVASTRDQDIRRLAIATAGSGDRDLFVSYVSEVPVWKASYRLVLPEGGGAPLLQGWAIVDNTIGEDWVNVELSLVAGAPQSFVQSISQPYYVQRPVVPLPERALLTPQTHQAGLATTGPAAITGLVTDSSGKPLPGVTVDVARDGARISQATTDASGRYRLSGTPGVYDVTFTLAGFRSASRTGLAVTGGAETVLNMTLQPAPVAEGVGGGRGGRQSSVNVTLDGVSPATVEPRSFYQRVGTALAEQQAAAQAADLGNLFEYRLREPVTIRQNQSALVPIVSSGVDAEIVSLWNPSANRRQALRAVWLTNTTGLTLDGGSFSVIEGQAFAGEGLIEPLKAGERRLLSFAADLGTMVDVASEAVPQRITRVEIARGVIVQRTEERQRRVYTARNDNDEPRDLVVEHPARDGWTLDGTVQPGESAPDWHRFRVTVAPRATATFTVDDVRPIESRYEVGSITDANVAILVRQGAIDAATEAALRGVLQRKENIVRLHGEIAARREEAAAIGRDQDRVRENMRALRGTSEERRLLQRYVRQLDEQENQIDTLRIALQALDEERRRAQADLDEFILTLSGG